jgi:hypothetical protein
MMKRSTLVLFAALASSAMAPVAPGHLPFISDDYARARAEAQKNHVPLFVEVWAPW